jgi:hypothetical protein
MTNTLTFREEGDVVIVDVCGALTIGSDSGALKEILHELAERERRILQVSSVSAA